MAIENNVGYDHDVGERTFNISLSPIYRDKYNKLRKITGLNNRKLLPKLLDIVFAEDSDSIKLIRRAIAYRIKAGVGYGYMVQLRLLHTILTVYLKRTGYLK